MIVTVSITCNILLKSFCLDLLVTEINEFPQNLKVLLTIKELNIYLCFLFHPVNQ